MSRAATAAGARRKRNTVKRTGKRKARPAAGAAKKTRQNKKQGAAAKKQIRKSFRQAVYGLYTISMVFLSLLLVGSTFVLWQWKNHNIIAYSREIQTLKTDVLRLKSEKSRSNAIIQTELLTERRVARISIEKLGLERSLKPPGVITVNAEVLRKYALKDQEEKK